jgi:predicted AAA+ superfamily ATPase
MTAKEYGIATDRFIARTQRFFQNNKIPFCTFESTKSKIVLSKVYFVKLYFSRNNFLPLQKQILPTMEILIRIYKRRLADVNTDLHRFIFTEIDWQQPLIGLKGQRGVGKTTMLLQRIKATDPSGERSFYVSLDNLWFADHSLLDLAERVLDKGVTHLYLDEVHRLPGWERQVKNLYDSYPELHVVFTGSSLLEIDHSIGDLSRRAAMYTLPGLSFREFLTFEGHDVLPKLQLADILYSHETIAPSIASTLNVVSLFKRYMQKGYYPFYKTMRLNDYYSRLAQTVTAVIESDIPAVENRIDYETLIKAKRLVSIISASLPYIPNISTLAGLMGSNRSQILKLLDLLHRAGIIRQLFMGERSPKSLAKPQKILLNNSSLMYALSDPQIGAARESTFASLLSVGHAVEFARNGDFMVDGRYLFEVGGKGKGFAQIRNIPDSFVAADDIELGFGNKIPLWLFGFLY